MKSDTFVGCREFRGKAPFVGYFEIKSPGILVIEPEMVKNVLIKYFKNFHDNEFSQMVCHEKLYQLEIDFIFEKISRAIRKKIRFSLVIRLCCEAKSGRKNVQR